MDDLILKHYEELYHHGVKGMKWGVRKQRSSSNKSAKKKKTKKAEDSFISEYKKERTRQKKYMVTKRAINAGTTFANKYLESHQATWVSTGQPVRISSSVNAVVNTVLNYKYAKDTLNK